MKAVRLAGLYGRSFGSVHTPGFCLIGELRDWDDGEPYFQRTATELSNPFDVSWQLGSGYGNKAMMSLEGLIRPISMDGDGGLPQYADPQSPCQKTTSIGAQPPIYDSVGGTQYYDEDLSQNYWNPFSNPTSKQRSQINSKCDDYVGHDMMFLARETGVPSSGLNLHVDLADPDGASYADDYRMFALRGPIVLQQWGYDTDGFPIPNKADTEVNASGGTFTDSSLQCKFMDKWLKKPHTWPVAPVDLRFDRGRGVWVSPQPYRFLRVTVDECVSGVGTFWASVVSGPTLYDCSGNTISTPKVEIDNDVAMCLESGTRAIVYYDAYECKYRLLEKDEQGIKAVTTPTTTGDVSQYGLTPCQVYDYSVLEIGPGLAIMDTGNCCRLKLDTNHSISSDDLCYTGTELTGPTRYEDFNLGGGLAMYTGEDTSEIVLDGNNTATHVGTGCANDLTAANNTKFYDLTSLEGIKLTSQGACNVGIGLCMDVEHATGTTTCVDGLKFSDCFTIIKDGCKASIELNNTNQNNTEVTVVTDTVCYTGCDASGTCCCVEVSKSKLKFNDCGLFVGTEDLGTTHDCY
jgi:hypothetical protein